MFKLKKIFPIVISLLLVNVAFPQKTITLKAEYRQKKLPFGLTEKVPGPYPVVAIALSGGGARGLAQIGVLKALHQAGIKFDIIAGTSMGSIIGGLYAAGYSLDKIDSIAVNTDWDILLASDRETNRRELFVDQKVTEDKAVFSLRLNGLKPVLPTSLSSGQKISGFLNLLALQAPVHADADFDRLRGKFRAVCTNLISGEAVIIGKGSLSRAMRASSSVSFFLSPVQYDSLTLVDGGLVANVPAKIARELGGDYVLAVNTTSELHPRGELSLPWEIADQVVSIPMMHLNQIQLKSANGVITPNLDNTGLVDFNNIETLIQKGYAAASKEIKNIKASMDSVFIKKIGQKEFYVNNIRLDSSDSGPGREYLLKYSTMDSVSSYKIIKDMYSIFNEGSYADIKTIIKEEGNYSTVSFIVESNPVVKKIIIRGVTIFDTSDVNSVFHGLAGIPYNPKKLTEKMIDLMRMYRNGGYSLADIKGVDFDKSSGTLSISVDEGKIDSIEVSGNQYTDKSIITREIPVTDGSYFNYNEIKEALTNLRSTNLFDDVYLSLVRKNNKNILDVSVEEKASSLLRVGFRVDNENKAQINLDIVDENLFGTGTEFGLLLSGGARTRSYILEQKSNRIFDTYLTYKINAYYNFNDVNTYADAITRSDLDFSRQKNGEYRQIFYGGAVSVGTQVQKFGNLIFEGKYQVDQVKNLSNAIVKPYKTKIVTLSASSTIDTQDKYPYPTKGIYFKGIYETANKILGGDLGYTKFDFQYKNYYTINGIGTFMPKVELGFADKTLPLSEQFSLGGQNSFFGMRDYEYRGRQIFLASLQYRYELPIKIFFDTYLKFRYDLGSTWQEQEEIRFKDLRHGLGATLSFDTPIGPAEFSVGRSFLFVKDLPGNPLSFGDVYFYFSIGYYY